MSDLWTMEPFEGANDTEYTNTSFYDEGYTKYLSGDFPGALDLFKSSILFYESGTIDKIFDLLKQDREVCINKINELYTLLNNRANVAAVASENINASSSENASESSSENVSASENTNENSQNVSEVSEYFSLSSSTGLSQFEDSTEAPSETSTEAPSEAQESQEEPPRETKKRRYESIVVENTTDYTNEWELIEKERNILHRKNELLAEEWRLFEEKVSNFEQDRIDLDTKANEFRENCVEHYNNYNDLINREFKQRCFMCNLLYKPKVAEVLPAATGK
jgi:hypothetical protein